MPNVRLFPLNSPMMMFARILLVLAVLMSSLVWLTLTAQAAPQTETSDTPRVEAWMIGNRLYVESNDLPRNQVFTLRARRASEERWTKLTRVQANRWGVLNKSVRLSGTLAKANRLQVCLKDKRASRQYCTWAWQLE